MHYFRASPTVNPALLMTYSYGAGFCIASSASAVGYTIAATGRHLCIGITNAYVVDDGQITFEFCTPVVRRISVHFIVGEDGCRLTLFSEIGRHPVAVLTRPCTTAKSRHR